MRPPVVLTVQATDFYGETTQLPLVVQRVSEQFVSLAPRDGQKLLVDLDELIAAVEGEAL